MDRRRDVRRLPGGCRSTCSPRARLRAPAAATSSLCSSTPKARQGLQRPIEIKKGYGVRLSARGYMDSTDWEVYGSKAEALKRARELAREAEGEDYATKKKTPTRHATKKSPAQLQREIDETLAHSNLTPAQREHIALFEQDVREHPGAYKAMVRDDPAGWALRTIEGLDDADVREFTRDLRAERKKVARLTGHSTKRRRSQGKHR